MSIKSKEVLFILPSLANGGAENVTINLLNSLVEEDYTCHLIVLTDVIDLELDDNRYASVTYLNSKSILKSTIALLNAIKLYRGLIFTPLTQCSILLLILKFLSLIRNEVIVIEHSYFKSWKRQLGVIRYVTYAALIRLLYKHAAHVVFCSKEMRDSFNKQFPTVKKVRTSTIYNLVKFDDINLKASECVTDSIPCTQSKNIVFCGRLSWEKNVKFIVRSLEDTLKNNNWHLLIIGDGADKEELIFLITKLGLTNYITLVGMKPNPYPYIKRADCLVLASHVEGFPTVLLEAISLETPIVAISCPTGPREIVNADVGQLVEEYNEELFARAVEKVATAPSNTYNFKHHLDTFDPRQALKKYSELINKYG